MDLVKLITDKITEMDIDGTISGIVETHVISCVNRIVEDSFRWNGQGKKAIEKALKDKLGVSLENVKISQYNKIVADIVTKEVENISIATLQKNIQDVVKESTGVLDKKEWKLSEIMQKFINSLDTSYDGMSEQYGNCSLFVKDDGSFMHIYFDEEAVSHSYKCRHSLFVFENKLRSVTMDRKVYSPFSTETHNDFEKFMFSLYCNNVTIINDEHDCELEYYREDVD